MIRTAALAIDFVSPLRQCDTAMVEIAASHRLLLTRLEVIAALESTAASGSIEALSALTQGPHSTWRPEMGLALAGLRNGNASAAALQLFLAYAATGSHGSIELHINHPTSLYIDGYTPLVCGPCRLAAFNEELSLICGQELWRWRRENGRFIAFGESAGHTLVYHSKDFAPQYSIWIAQHQPHECLPWLPIPLTDAPRGEPAVSITKTRETIRDSLEFIGEFSSAHQSWIHSAIACYLLLDPAPPRLTQYFGFYENPGLAAVRSDCSLIECCESLISQSTYQHMLMYLTFDPLVLQGRNELQYSPCARIYRPVDELLCSMHILGNLILFSDRCLKNGAQPIELLKSRLMYRAIYLEEYRPMLQRAVSLSEAGLAFWQDLRDQVDECIL